MIASAKRSNFEVPIQFEDKKATSSRWNGLATSGLRAVGDPMHIETSLVRNLGDLIHAQTYVPGRFADAIVRSGSSLHCDYLCASSLVRESSRIVFL